MVNQFGLPINQQKNRRGILLYTFFYRGTYKDTAGHHN